MLLDHVYISFWIVLLGRLCRSSPFGCHFDMKSSWLLVFVYTEQTLLWGPIIPIDINEPNSLTAFPVMSPGLQRKATMELLRVPLISIYLVDSVNSVLSASYITWTSGDSFGLTKYIQLSMSNLLSLVISFSTICDGNSGISISLKISHTFPRFPEATLLESLVML